MSAPFLFIILPLLLGMAALAVSRWDQLLAVAGTSITGLLALVAWIFPIDAPIIFGPWTLQIGAEIQIAGTTILVSDGFRALLALYYGGGFLWFLGAQIIREQTKIILLGMVFLPLLVLLSVTAGLIQAGILVLFCILTGVILLSISNPGARVVSGALGFMTFSLFAVPCLLMAGGLVPGLVGSPAGLDIVVRPSILLGLGFAFLLAVFPFYAWVPRMAESNRPFRVAFVLMFMNIAVSVMGVLLVDRFVWLRESERIFAVLRFTGLLVMTTGGFMAAFQQNWGRQLGFALLIENGLFLAALGSGLDTGITAIAALLLVRVLGILVWSCGLDVVYRLFGTLDLKYLAGASRTIPYIGAAALVGQFSTLGLPLLAGFGPRLTMMTFLGPTPESVGVWVAMLGMALGGLRVLSVLYLRPGKKEKLPEQPVVDPLGSRFQEGFLVAGALILLFFGLFPHWYGPFVSRFPLIFSQLVR